MEPVAAAFAPAAALDPKPTGNSATAVSRAMFGTESDEGLGGAMAKLEAVEAVETFATAILNNVDDDTTGRKPTGSDADARVATASVAGSTAVERNSASNEGEPP